MPDSSYVPGLTASNVADVLDVAGIRFADKLRAALRAFNSKLHGYLTEEAVLVGVESRTSSPVRVPRATLKPSNRRIWRDSIRQVKAQATRAAS